MDLSRPHDESLAEAFGQADFHARHIGPTAEDEARMLELIGCASRASLIDETGQAVLAEWGEYRSPRDGAQVVLTIDRNVQLEAERLLTEALDTYEALRGNILVLDPRTVVEEEEAGLLEAVIAATRLREGER